MSTRLCTECAREFKPSSRHAKCPACRSRRRAQYDSCTCGQKKRVESIHCLPCSTRGELNGNWRGGVTYHKAGYVMVRVDGHPRATNASSPYVFEHILVMEEHLGRYLYPDENVHHKFGVKDDNRIDRLELWVKPQPTGVRAADALAWAKEIMARYQSVDLEPIT